MMFIVWGLVAILMIVLNMIEVIRRQKEVVVRASLGENAAVIALKAVVADMIDVYKRQALDSQANGQIKILSHAKVRNGDLFYDHKEQIR